MFSKKKTPDFLETRWCLGTTIENNQYHLYPVYKHVVFLHEDAFVVCHGNSELQGILAVSPFKSLWLAATNEPIETVLKHLPELEMHMIKEERL